MATAFTPYKGQEAYFNILNLMSSETFNQFKSQIHQFQLQKL